MRWLQTAYANSNTSRGIVFVGRLAPWTSCRTRSVVSRENTGSRQRVQTCAGMCSTSTRRPIDLQHFVHELVARSVIAADVTIEHCHDLSPSSELDPLGGIRLVEGDDSGHLRIGHRHLNMQWAPGRCKA